MKIVIAGTGYLVLFNVILLAQRYNIVSLDMVIEKAGLINRKLSPIVDAEIENYLQHKPRYPGQGRG